MSDAKNQGKTVYVQFDCVLDEADWYNSIHVLSVTMSDTAGKTEMEGELYDLSGFMPENEEAWDRWTALLFGEPKVDETKDFRKQIGWEELNSKCVEKVQNK